MELDLNFYKGLLDKVDDGIYVVNSDRKIVYWNKGAEKLTGFKQEEVLGSSCSAAILVHVDNEVHPMCEVDCPLAGAAHGRPDKDRELFLRHKDGHRVRVSVSSWPIKSEDGNLLGAVEVFTDNRRQEIFRERIFQLEQLALLDPVTRLANRQHSEETVKKRLNELSRYGRRFGVLFADIDGFKAINDRYGHEVGDRALKLAANSMMASLRPFDFLGRWGGDEFVAIVTDVDCEALYAIAERMRKLVWQSKLTVGGTNVAVTVSIGATLAEQSDSIESLIKRADSLMYKSKKSGRNMVAIEQKVS